VIQPGQRLKTRPLLGQTAAGPRVEEMDWAALPLAAGAGTRIEAPNGPYYGHRPAADRQTQARYFESSPSGPLATYQEAIRLWRAFEDAIARLAPLSSALQGWYVVIDPGHGGLDPGAVVEALDGSGGRLYVVEDEYAFDTAIRAYVLLRLHGARVAMTVLSPNHLVRHSTPPVQTYVNEKNEVYNNLELNQPDRRIDWPRGANLEKRVRLARRAFDGTPKERRIFLSFHADIDPHSPPVPLVLYYTSRNGRRQDLVSRAFARGLLPSLGAGARTRGQPLGVLRDNPAQVKVLLELRNLAYIDQAWALRFEQLRQRDAEKVVRGVLEYARRRPLSARR
jgi:N-acetylmuramoyl-L-alanine amidase